MENDSKISVDVKINLEEKIKVVIGTDVAKEGLSFMRVREL